MKVLESAFQKEDSFIHHIDPRIKILCSFVLTFSIALLKNLESSLIIFFVSILLIFFSCLDLKKVISTLFFANLFIAFLWLFLPFSTNGRPAFYIWKWAVTYEGMKLSFLITLKCNAMLMTIITFIASIPVPTMGYALGSFGFPDKFVLILLMAYRYIHVIFDEYKRLSQALKIRCFKPGTNLHTYRTYAYLIAMVFIRSYERGIRIYQAMLLRGFNGKFYILRDFHIKKIDLLFFGIIISLSFLLLFLDRGIASWHPF